MARAYKPKSDSIRCPRCGELIPISETLHHQLSEQARAELRRELVEERKALASKEKQLEAEEKELRANQQDLEKQVEKRVASEKARLAKEAMGKARGEVSVELKELRDAATEKDKKLEEAQDKELQLRKEKRDLEAAKKAFELDSARKIDEERQRIREEAAAEADGKVREELAVELQELRQASAEKDEKLKDTQERELQLRKEKRDLEAAKREFELSSTRKLDEERQQIRENAVKEFEEGHKLKDAEKDRKLQEAAKANEELRRKLDQGSQQAQGEVLELELEKLLTSSFPADEVLPVLKGVRGADILQKVRTKTGLNCGSILWETKYTKNWSESWIGKLKEDQQGAKADLAVLVTDSLPKDVDGFAPREGVWLSRPRYAYAVAAALRNILTEVAVVRSATVSKNETIESLFQYLTGAEFRQRVEAIVRAFMAIKEDLDDEKRVSSRRWAKREKQLDVIIGNTSGMYGDFQGLLGTSMKSIAALEAGPSEESGEAAAEPVISIPESSEDDELPF